MKESKIKYYVSLEGDDKWSGTAPDHIGGGRGPFRTIIRAKEEVRYAIMQGMNSDIKVFIRGGNYNLEKPLIFDEVDGGRDGYKVIYTNYCKEVPFINGGKIIKGWSKYNEKIYMIEVGEGIDFNTLYENSIKANKARYPLKGYNKVTEMVDDYSRCKFRFGVEDLPLLKDTDGLQAYLWPGGREGDWNWYTNTINIADIDYNQRVISLKNKAIYDIGCGSRYFIQNSLELLTEPGEFYYDREVGILYYQPRKLPIEDQKIIIPMMDRIIQFKGNSRQNPVSDICMNGLTIGYSDLNEEIIKVKTEDSCQNLKGAIQMENVVGIEIKNCHIHNTGLHGIYLKGLSRNNKIYGNYIEYIGHTGIQIEGIAEPECFSSRENEISNNYIHDTGQLVGHGAGIQLIQSGKNIISHNRIDNTPRYSISLKSYRLKKDITDEERQRDNILYTGYNRDNIIEYNDVSRANIDSQDTGAIEIWGGSAGNIIRNNHIHDCNIYLSFGFAIYLDDCADFCRVENNLIEGLQKEGKGRLLYAIYAKGIEDIIVNNIIADNNVYRAALGTFEMNNPNRDLESKKNIIYNSGDIYYFQNWGDNRFAISDYNLFYNNEGKYCILNEVRYQENQYKEMGGIEDIEWNEIEFDEWQEMYQGRHDNNSIIDAPSFINPDIGDYRLRYDSPVYQLGFEDIEYASIGLKDDFMYRDKSDQLNRVFAGVQGQESRGHIALKIGQNIQLSIKARTASGYISDLSEAKFIFKSNQPEVFKINEDGILTTYKAGTVRAKVSVIKAGVKRSVVFDVIVN